MGDKQGHPFRGNHPGGELRRVSLWRGWLWRRASACRETVLDEAGIGRVLFGHGLSNGKK
jgi:hypothetical protein